MGDNDPILLYIIFRESLHLDNKQIAYYAADAVQHILLKYFMMQLLAQKTHLDVLRNDAHITMTTKWLASHSKKAIISVDDDIWFRLKNDFSMGRDIYALKDKAIDDLDIETTLVFWPAPDSQVPTYIK